MTLESKDGATRLSYRCDQIVPQAETAADMTTVVENLSAVYTEFVDQSKLLTLQDMTKAQQRGDIRALELAIVRYRCEKAVASSFAFTDNAAGLAAIGVLASGVLSWLITHMYYRKALQRQEQAASEQLKPLLALVEHGRRNQALDAEYRRQKRIEDCLAEYHRAGTPVAVIDTYDDLDSEEKADLLDLVLVRARGRPAKNNKYRYERPPNKPLQPTSGAEIDVE